MAVNSQGRAHIEEVRKFSRNWDRAAENPVILRAGRDLEELPRRTREPAEASSPYGTSCREATRLDGNPMRAIIMWRCWLLALNDVVGSEDGAKRAAGTERSSNLPRDWRSVGTTPEGVDPRPELG